MTTTPSPPSPVISDRAYRRRHRLVLGLSLTGAMFGLVAFAFGGGILDDRVDDTRASVARTTQQARALCAETNIVRSNQAYGIAANIESTARSLAKPHGLGPLEAFREQITEQLDDRRTQLRRLRVREERSASSPYLVNCKQRFPLP